MNPIRKWSSIGKTCVLILFAFLMPSAIAHNISHPTAKTLKSPQNISVQFHRRNDTAPSHPIILNQSLVKEIQQVKNMIDDLADWLKPTHNVRHRQKRSGPQRPDLDNKLTMMKTLLNTMDQKLESLLLTRALSSEDRIRISELETSANGLRTSVDNQRQELVQYIDEKINEKIENLNQAVNRLNLKVDALENYFIQQEAKRRLPAEIVNDIKSRRFSTAEEKLVGMDDNTYYYVVHEVFNNQAGNFDLLLNFGDSIQDMERKFKIYDSLYKEAAANGLKDPEKLLRLSQSIRIRIIDRTIGAIAAKKLYEILLNAIQEAAVEPIYSAFLSDNSWTTIKQLSANIADECSRCTVKIFDSVIETIWNTITVEELLSRSRQHLKYVTEDMAVHLAVMNKLERIRALHTTSVMTLARYMKLTMEESKYRNVDSSLRSQYEEAKNKIPQSVKNLVFSSAICIKNTRYNEYLYAAAAPDYVYDDERRNVFTWIPGNRDEPSKFKWRVTFRNDHEIALSNYYYNEYLYAGGYTYDDTRRYAFTWRNGNPVSNGIWQVEIDEDGIYMFNTEHKEYLFADYDEIKHETRRYVFTYRKGGKTSDSKWHIVDCSDFY